MQQPAWVQACVKTGQNLSFTRGNAALHNVLNLTLCACLGFGAAVAVFGSKWVTSTMETVSLAAGLELAIVTFYATLATAVVGWCYFGLLILVVHESSHGMFLVHGAARTRRTLNHWSGVLVCVPFAIDFVTHWEEGHLVHHRKPLERDDPQRLNTRTGAEFWRLFWSLLLIPGFAFVERFMTKRNRKRGMGRGSAMLRFLVFWVVAGVVVWHIVSPLGVLIALCGLQVLSALNQLKGALEHGGTIGKNPNPLLRSRTTLLPFRWLLMPFNISLHFEHHLNATVPWYALPSYHRAIHALVPDAERPTFFSSSALANLR